jgi:hypothetical protein
MNAVSKDREIMDGSSAGLDYRGRLSVHHAMVLQGPSRDAMTVIGSRVLQSSTGQETV